MKFPNGLKYVFALVLLVLLPVQAVVANTVVRSGETVTLSDNQSIEGSFYVAGGTVALAGKVTGDTTVFGGNVTIGGEVTDDLAVLAGTLNLQSPVGEDVRIVAGQVTITDTIKGDLVVVAGKVNISSKATIEGDVLFYGGELVLEGAVNGKVLGSADSVRVDGVVGKGVDMSVRSLTLGEQANITGDVEYTSDVEVVRAPGAVVSGVLVKNDVPVTTTDETELRSIAIMFLVSLFATLALYLMFRRQIETFGRMVQTGRLTKSALGFVALFMGPLIVTILLVSILGAIVGLIALCGFALLAALAVPLLSVTVGAHLVPYIGPKKVIAVPHLILGSLLLQAMVLIPIVGMAVVVWIYFLTVGTLIQAFYSRIRP